MSEEEIMQVLNDMMEHYDNLAQKNYEKGKSDDYAQSMWIACNSLKRRLRTKFKNRAKNTSSNEGDGK